MQGERILKKSALAAMLNRVSPPGKRFEPDMALGGLVADFCCPDLCLAFDLVDEGRDAKARAEHLKAMGVRLVTLPSELLTGWHRFAARRRVLETIGAEIHIARSRMDYIADMGCKAPF